MDKIAVSCPTEDEWNKVKSKLDFVKGEWKENREYSHICVRGNKFLGRGNKDSYTSKDYTILSASDYLAYGLEGRWKVGDKVRILGDDSSSHIVGEVGTIVKVDPNDAVLTYVVEADSHRGYIDTCELELVTTPKHTVPLRVDDRVRVVGYHTSSLNGTEATIIDGYKGNFDHLVELVGGDYQPISKKYLELIPTEADITVGSVWENVSGSTYTIEGLDGQGDPITKEVGVLCKWAFVGDRSFAKLIHRGDGERPKITRELVEAMSFDSEIHKVEKQTKKKEKKMKRAEKIIKETDVVFDRECGNEGVVVGVFPKTNQASYEDYNGGKVLTVSIDNLYLQFVAPKIVEVKPKKKTAKKKPVKKKTKKTTKKGKK